MTIKIIALAAALATTASVAAADNYFELGENVMQNSVIDLGIVRSEAAGIVEIYDFKGGDQGTLLGAETVNAGANTDVRINLGSKPLSDVIAVLKIDGEVVATRDYDIN